jgi:hypothetical protein
MSKLVLVYVLNKLHQRQHCFQVSGLELRPLRRHFVYVHYLNTFTDLYAYLNELSMKLQGLGKPIDVMFSIITTFAKKLRLYQCDMNIRIFLD